MTPGASVSKLLDWMTELLLRRRKKQIDAIFSKVTPQDDCWKKRCPRLDSKQQPKS